MNKYYFQTIYTLQMYTHSLDVCICVNKHPEQWAANAAALGEQLGFGALFKGLTSVVVLRVERALVIHSPYDSSCQTWDSNPQPAGYLLGHDCSQYIYICVCVCVCVYI